MYRHAAMRCIPAKLFPDAFSRQSCLHYLLPAPHPDSVHRFIECTYSTSRKLQKYLDFVIPSYRLHLVLSVTCFIVVYCESKTPMQSFCDNFGERGPILIILSLLHSKMNCRKRRNKICRLASNMLPHYLAKLEL